MRMESKGLIGSCLCMLVAGGGCVAGRKTVAERTFGERDSLIVERYDSLWAERVWKSDMQTTLRWEEVSFSAPDSNGRQHVGQIRRAVADCRQVSVSQDTLLSLSRQEGRWLGNSGYGAERKRLVAGALAGLVGAGWGIVIGSLV